MANYNVACKLVEGNRNTIEDNVAEAINSIDDTKTIRAIVMDKISADNFVVLIIYDA